MITSIIYYIYYNTIVYTLDNWYDREIYVHTMWHGTYWQYIIIIIMLHLHVASILIPSANWKIHTVKWNHANLYNIIYNTSRDTSRISFFLSVFIRRVVNDMKMVSMEWIVMCIWIVPIYMKYRFFLHHSAVCICIVYRYICCSLYLLLSCCIFVACCSTFKRQNLQIYVHLRWYKLYVCALMDYITVSLSSFFCHLSTFNF
jgi:hypothetical protein